MAGAVQGDLREGMEAYLIGSRAWPRTAGPMPRTSSGCAAHLILSGRKKEWASNIITPALRDWRPLALLDFRRRPGLRPFWDHYLATGDVNFLRKRVVPALKELALFYEDFLTVTDKDGNYIFAPSFSPENNPVSTDPSGPVLVNAAIDIAVCREVLSNLIQACETLGIEVDSVPKWKAMLARMPPYLLERDGTLKEWAWPTLQERYAIGMFLISTEPGPATRSIRTALRNSHGPR